MFFGERTRAFAQWSAVACGRLQERIDNERQRCRRAQCVAQYLKALRGLACRAQLSRVRRAERSRFIVAGCECGRPTGLALDAGGEDAIAQFHRNL